MNFILLYIKYWIKEFIFSKDAWIPGKLLRPFIIGIILGLAAFWNGAVVIAVLPVLAIMAVFSKHRLELLIIAVLTVTLSVAQSMFFTNGASGKPELFIGFLMHNDSLTLKDQLILIYNSYAELFGILLFALIACLFAVPRGGRWLILAFLSPLVLATTFKFSVDVGANHVIIIFSVILLNIIIANLIYRLFTSRSLLAGFVGLVSIGFLFGWMSGKFKFEQLKIPTLLFFFFIVVIVILAITIFDIIKKSSNLKRALSIAAAIILVVMLTCTGVIDSITLYNNDSHPGNQYQLNDPLIKWVSENTKPNDIFLINPTFTHKILMAGRRIFLGYAYFNWSAGYPQDERYNIVKEIYGGTDPAEVKKILKEQRISYVVIEDGNRASTDYKLNENLFKNNFGPPVYSGEGTDIYKVN
jgi:hypothetical protein